MAVKDREAYNKYQRDWARNRAQTDPIYRAKVVARSRANYRKNNANWKCSTPEEKRKVKLRTNFGLSTAQYADMLQKQNGKCAACGRPPGKKLLAVDHCHTTGNIRGLLCTSCNLVVGWIENNPGRIKQAEDYIERTNHEENIFGVIP